MPRDVPYLDAYQRELIRSTLSFWAEVHPRRDVPLIMLADGSEFTPRTFADAAAEPDSPRGQHVYRVFAAGLIADGVEPPESLEEILADFQRDAQVWSDNVGQS